MKVTGVEKVSGSRFRIRLEDGSAFVLYRGELRSFHIEEGQEIAPEKLQTILAELLPRRAKLRALNLLTRREYTVRQLRDKLVQGEYPEKVIEEALAYVAGYRYTDDLRYAAGYIADHEGDRSARRIQQDLLQKGIDRETLEEAWRQWEEKGGCREEKEQEQLQRLLEKRQYNPETADQRERQRQYAFLLRRGYSPEQIRRAMEL